MLAPPQTQPLDSTAEFILFDVQDTMDPGVIERGFLEAILQADLFYLVNPGGYVGLNVAFEFGFAAAARASKKWMGIIAAQELPEDEHTTLLFSLFGIFVGTPQETALMVQSGRTLWY